MSRNDNSIEQLQEKLDKIRPNTYKVLSCDIENRQKYFKILCKKHGHIFKGTKTCVIARTLCCPVSSEKEDSASFFFRSIEAVKPGVYEFPDRKFHSLKTPIRVICKIHNNEFENLPRELLASETCCKKTLKHSLESFIEKVEEIFPGVYDFSVTDKNFNYKKRIKVRCKKHNRVFSVQPFYLTSRKDCCPVYENSSKDKEFFKKISRLGVEARRNKLKNMQKKETPEILEKTKKELEDLAWRKVRENLEKYIKDDPKSILENWELASIEKIDENKPLFVKNAIFNFRCKKHNDSARIKSGNIYSKKVFCNECVRDYYMMKDIEKFEKEKGDKFPYIKIDPSDINTVYYGYKSVSRRVVAIYCEKHGKSYAFVSNLNKNRFPCTRCTLESIRSGLEEKFEEKYLLPLVEQFRLKYDTNFRFHSNEYEMDFFFPDHGVGVEIDGSYWHSSLKKGIFYHQNKKLYFLDKGVNVIFIKDYQLNDGHLMKKIMSILMYQLGLIKNRIAARKCRILDFTNENSHLFRKFMKRNHIKGCDNPSFMSALLHEGEIVCAMGIVKTENRYELTRFATKKGTAVPGGMSRLLYHMAEKYEIPSLDSYCDLDFYDGRGYHRIGFENRGVTVPNFSYLDIVSGKVFSLEKFSKHRLSAIFDHYDSNSSEEEICFAEGFIRVYGCGNTIFHKNFSILH